MVALVALPRLSPRLAFGPAICHQRLADVNRFLKATNSLQRT